jgi:nucleoid-associated protein YgaU
VRADATPPAGDGPDRLVLAAAAGAARVAAGYLLLCVAVLLAGGRTRRRRRLPGTPRRLAAVADLALGAVLVTTSAPAALADGPAAPACTDSPSAGSRSWPSLGWPVAATPAEPTEVVVRPGDSLWQIAATALPRAASPAAVAQAWPRWWQANRSRIGPDPGLIRPGQRLVAPHPTSRSPR